MRASNQLYLAVFNSATRDILKLYTDFISYIISSHPDFYLDCSEEQDYSCSNSESILQLRHSHKSFRQHCNVYTSVFLHMKGRLQSQVSDTQSFCKPKVTCLCLQFYDVLSSHHLS